MFTYRIAMKFAAAAVLATALSAQAQSAQARATPDHSAIEKLSGAAVEALTPMFDAAGRPANGARQDDNRLPRLAIQWGGSNTRDDIEP
jgi:hypothetical protein